MYIVGGILFASLSNDYITFIIMMINTLFCQQKKTLLFDP